MEPMRVKGTTIISTSNFVKNRFGQEGFDRWIEQLSPAARDAITVPLASKWYDMVDCYTEPLEKIVSTFLGGAIDKGGREIGSENAKHDLTGIYRIMIKFGSPNLMISGAARTWNSYYSEGEPEVVENEKGRAVVSIREIPVKSAVWEYSVAGWVETASMLAGGKNNSCRILSSVASGQGVLKLGLTWE